MAKGKGTKGQTTIYKTPYKKLKIEQQEYAVPAPLVALVVLLSYKPSDKSCIRKSPESAYDKWNISVVIWDTYIP
jgi:hypothetical protein